jgi:hypothetical protein
MAKKNSRSTKKTVRKASIKKSAPKRVAAKKRVVKKAAPKRKAPAKRSSSKRATTIRITAPKVRSRLSPYSLAYSLGILKALSVLAMSVLGKGQDLLSSMLFSYSTSVQGVIVGMIEAAIWGLVAGFVLGWLYNKFN